MEKRKAISKGRLTKSKPEAKKLSPEDIQSNSTSRLTKLTQLPDPSKKSPSPLSQKILKAKVTLSKRSAETPKPKLEDPDNQNSAQEQTETQSVPIINSLIEKISKQKSISQQLEDKLKNLEQEFRLNEASNKKEFENLVLDNRKIRKEKMIQEGKIMEENFLIRKEFEECKIHVKAKVDEVIGFLKRSQTKDTRAAVEELIGKLGEIVPSEGTLIGKLDLRGTASFSHFEPEVVTPPSAVSNGFMEAIALHSHIADSSEEITLSPGDRVMVFSSDEVNGWWIGKVRDEIGRFPKTCVMLD